MNNIVPVILSGGSGTRLWPLSRGLNPKQFMPFGGSTLFGNCLSLVQHLKNARKPLAICNESHRFIAASIMHQYGVSPSAKPADSGEDLPRLILEPVARNTAPAIAVSAFAALESADNDVTLLVLPSDHHIPQPELFTASIARGAEAAQEGMLVTFGIPPTHPATGFGYIVKGEEIVSGYKVSRFVEKPIQEKAEKLLAEGNCYWNSGMFMFSAKAFLQELERLQPAMYSQCRKAWEKRFADMDFIRLDEESFSDSPSESVDYAIMEHTNKACVVPFSASWYDLGSWESFHQIAEHDDNNNSTVGDVELLDCKNSYVHASTRLVTAIGLEDIIVVETADAVLALRQGKGQDVKTLLKNLKDKGRSEVDSHLTVHRPWGSYQTLVLSERFQVKRIVVKPGGVLSLQLHHHRAEHWTIVRGTAKIVLDDKELLLSEDQSTYIPLGTKHRLVNPGHIDLELIEVQTGSYLGEDDIVRLEDIYNR